MKEEWTKKKKRKEKVKNSNREGEIEDYRYT